MMGTAEQTARLSKTLSLALACVLGGSLLLSTSSARAQSTTYAARLLESASKASAPAAEQGAPAQRRISVRLEERTVEEALRHVAEKAALRLSYGSQAVAVEKKVTLQLEQVTALEALQAVLRGTGLQLMPSEGGGSLVLIRPIEAVEILPVPARVVPADLGIVQGPEVQTGIIAGTVTAEATGEPLPGVNVVVEGTQQGAATGPEGSYEITGVEPGTYTVRASFIGYGDETQEGMEVADGEATVVNFALEQEAAGLDEVVVVGYGEQQRRDLTGSVSSISGEEIEEASVTSVDEALQCESRVEGKQEHGGSEPPEGMHEQALVGAHL